MSIFDGLKKMVGVVDSNEALLAENDKQLKNYMKKVQKINELEPTYENYTNEQFKQKTEEFKKSLKKGASLDSILCDAFALAREASWRILKLRHYDVQVLYSKYSNLKLRILL